MIRIDDTPKPKDKFGSIPIREGKAKTDFSFRPPPPPSRPKPFFLWRWLRRSIILLILLALILVIVSPLLVPYLASTLLAEHLSTAMNRPVTIPRAEFNPLSLTLTLHHLIVGPELSRPNDPVDPLFSAGTVSITVNPKRLLDQEVACAVTAEHLFLHLVRQKDGSYNISQPIKNILPDSPLLPLRISCNTLSLSDSRLIFDDALNGKTHLAEDLSLSVAFPAKNQGQTSPLRLLATVNTVQVSMNGAEIQASPLAQPAAPPQPTPQAEKHSTPETPPDDAAIKTAEAIAFIQDIRQAVRQYLPNSANPPFESQAGSLLTP